MAKKEIVICDRCNDEVAIDEHISLSFVIDRKLDASGSIDNEFEYIDLCNVCASIELEGFVTPLSNTERKEWIAKIRREAEYHRL